MRHWRVLFGRDGAIKSITEIQGQPAVDWIVVRAATEALARKKAMLSYCARKKRQRIAQLHAEGRCKCGRKQDGDRVNCSVCIERAKGYRAKRLRRNAEGTADTHSRDEGARVAAFQGRSRDRRNELRLETLLEVRRWWLESRNVGIFSARLEREITACTGGGEPVNDVLRAS